MMRPLDGDARGSGCQWLCPMRILLLLLILSLSSSIFSSQVEKEWVVGETQGAASWLTGDTDTVQQHLRVTRRGLYVH